MNIYTVPISDILPCIGDYKINKLLPLLKKKNKKTHSIRNKHLNKYYKEYDECRNVHG